MKVSTLEEQVMTLPSWRFDSFIFREAQAFHRTRNEEAWLQMLRD